MNAKTILGTTLTAVFAVSMIMTPAFAASSGYLTIKSSSSTISSGELNASIKTKSAIPTNGKAGAFGYAVLTNGGSGDLDNVLVIVTHLGIDDSSFENPRSGFHAHVLDLTIPLDDACAGFDAEVDLLASVANTSFDPDYSYKIRGNVLTISGIPTSDLGDATAVDAIVAFTVTPVFSGTDLTNLCVDVI